MADTTQPNLSFITIPRTIDLSSGAKDITLLASASDEQGGSGISRVIFYTDGGFNGGATYFFGSSSDPWADGSTATTIRVPVSQSNGNYNVTSAIVYDNAGNSRSYSAFDLQNLGVNTVITVTGGDNTGPTLTALSFDRTVDLSNGNATFHYQASATDARSGVASLSFTVYNSTTGQYLDDYYLFSASDWADGTNASTDTIYASTPPGTYQITNLRVTDTVGNTSTYSTAQLQAAGFQTTFTVSGSDTAGPTLTALSFDPTVSVANGNATFHFQASATDRSGVASLSFTVYNSTTGQYLDDYYLSSTSDWGDGTSASTDTIYANTPPGSYKIGSLRVTDTQGNVTTYSTAQLQAAGFQTTFTVSGSDTAGPTLTALSFDQTVSVANGNATFHYQASATDRSGVASLSFDVYNSAGQYFDAYYLSSSSDWGDGSSASTDTIYANTPPGTYHIGTLRVTDTLGNVTTYSTAQLQAAGFQTTFTVGSDTTKPTLTGLVVPATVDVSSSAKNVTFQASGTDNDTGISDVTIHFSRRFDGATGIGTIDLNGVGDTWADGSSALTTTFATTTPPGDYTVTDAVVTDGAGNKTTYTTAQLQALGFNTKLTVVGDSTKPLLTALTFPTSVDVAPGARNQPFSASATDNATGIRDLRIHFDRNWETGTGTRTVDLNGVADSWADGSSSLIVSIPSTSRSGTYNITSVEVIDGAGNIQIYTAAQLRAKGIATALTITGGTSPGDTTPPNLTGLTFDTSVNLAEGAQNEAFTAKASDNASSIRGVKVYFDKDWETGTGTRIVDINGAGDSWPDGASTLNLSIPQTARNGTYTITRVDVTDTAGNLHTYTTSQIAALGIKTSLTITGSYFDSVAPELTALGFTRTVDVSGGAKAVNFLAAGTDNSSGIRDVKIHFDKDLLGGSGTGLITIAGTSNDPWSDGSSAFVTVIPTTARNGTYGITSVDITDKAGNVRSYTTAQLSAAGFNTSLTISGAQATGTPDTIGPQVSSVTMPGVVDVRSGSTARFDLYAPATDQTGVSGGAVYLDHGIRIKYDSVDTTASGFAFGADGHASSYFANAVGSPIYVIGSLSYTDTNGIQRTYSTADLAAFGLQTSFFVLNASFNVSVSAVFGGTFGSDTLTGTIVNNVLYGLDGNDTIVSGGGVDWLYGGKGSDAYYISNSATHIIELSGEGTADIVYTSVSYTLSASLNIEFLSASSLSSTTAMTLIGNELANTITGNAGANLIRGGLGRDVLNGSAGIDTADYSDKSSAVVVTLNRSTSVSVSVGGVAEDTIVNIENLIGGSAIDRLTGDDLANTLDGRGGADTLIGGLGNDTYVYDGTDTITEAAGAGTDTIQASVTYTLRANIENLTLLAAAGNASGLGNELVNFLTGNAGNNSLDGKVGADTMSGLAGNDLYYIDNAGDKIIEGANQGTSDRLAASVSYVLAASVQVETLQTTYAAGLGAINLTGNELVQTIYGNAGINRLDGKAGADTLYGYGGNDVYTVDNAGDRVFEAADGGTDDRIVAGVSYTLAATQHIEVLQTISVAGTVAINLTGNELGQTLFGNAGANTLDGKGGADTLSGLGGNDTYLVDNAGDNVVEATNGGTADRVFTSISYVLTAGQEIETLTTTSSAGTGAINLTGNDLVQTLFGNAGVNRLDGKGGADTLTGLGGNDIYTVDNAGDRVVEAAGGGTDDRVVASVSYTLTAGQSIEVLGTTSAAATSTIYLTGNELAQTIVGNAGTNRLDGKVGADTLTGLGGQDTFLFSTTLNTGDRITDFVSFDDTVQLSKSVFAALAAGRLSQGAFKDLGVTGATVDADDRIIYSSKTGVLSYDADGSGTTQAAHVFAILTNKAVLTFDDFLIV